MKTLNRIFYDILLKIHSDDSKKFKINKDLVKKHLFQKTEIADELLVKITEYLERFYDFCFVLEYDIMIKGQINFKH